MTPLIDTHTHLYVNSFLSDIDAVLQRAADAGIEKAFLPAIDSETHQRLIELAERVSPVSLFPMMGLHPCSVKEDFENELSIVRQHLDSGKKFYAVGETGLDYYWDLTYKEQQQVAFERQIEWAVEQQLPVVIHSRESTADCITTVSKFAGRATGIFHCFSGTTEQAIEIVELGFHLGIGGTFTYKNSNLRDVLKTIGLGNVVLETDSPYLAPVPHRGKRNETAYIQLVCDAIAQALDKTHDEVASITTENAHKVFRLNV